LIDRTLLLYSSDTQTIFALYYYIYKYSSSINVDFTLKILVQSWSQLCSLNVNSNSYY